MRFKNAAAMALLLLLPSIFILIWFREGTAFGGGDVGLPTFNPKRIFEFISHIWWEASAPGFPRPHGTAGIPFYFLLSLLQEFFTSYVAIQKIIFWLTLTLMGVGMYFVAKKVFGKDKILIPLASGLLYLINPYMMISVWHRFVHTTFFLAAALPFIFIVWARWINQGKAFDLIVFALINIFGSIIFSTLGFVPVLWILLGGYFVYSLTFPKKSLTEGILLTKRFFLGLFVWTGISLWWILPVASSGSTIFSQQHSSLENSATLLSLANQSTIPFTLQGINPFYLLMEMDWGEIYGTWGYMLMPWLWVFFAMLGFVKGLGDKRFFFWSFFFLLAVFLAKGAAAPFGGGFTYLFERIFFLGVLRNPFEKIGIFIPFVYAILIPLGFLTFFKLTQKIRFRKLILAAVVILFFLSTFIWHFPLWQGKVFGSRFDSQQVLVPEYYFEADNWIKQQALSGRILHVPLNVSESTAYKWGYSGVEPSQVFFTSNPSISQGFNLNFVDSALRTLQIYLEKADLIDPLEIKKLLSLFGVRFVVLHTDIDTAKLNTISPEKLKINLEKLSFLEKKRNFGKLIVYEVAEEQSADIVYFLDSFDYLFLGEENSFWPWFIKDHNLLSFQSDSQNGELMQKAQSLIVSPADSFSAPPSISINRENILDEMPSVRILPTSLFYNLIKLKEHYETYSSFGNARLLKQILFSGKRLAEAFKAKEQNINFDISATLLSYEDLLEKLHLPLKSSLPIQKDVLESIFFRHFVVLDNLKELGDDMEQRKIAQVREKLGQYLARWKLLPLFSSDDQSLYFGKKVYAFNIAKEAEYQVIFGLNEGISTEDVDEFSIDGVPADFASRQDKTDGLAAVNLGSITLKPGYHELSYRSKVIPAEIADIQEWIRADNGQYALTPEGFSITGANHENTEIEISAKDFVRGSIYTMQFDYWVQNGNGPRLQVLNDNDIVIKGKRVMEADKIFSADSYNRHWQKAFASFRFKENANEIKFKLIISPWNDCEKVSPVRSLCKTAQFRKKFERPSKVFIRNLTLQRVSEPPLFLKAEIAKEELFPEKSFVVSYQRVSPTYLSGTVEVKKPSFLVFAETFDTGWKLDLNKNGRRENIAEHVLANVFSNGWYIKEPGQYQFTIYFAPQKLVGFGSIISLITLGGLLWYQIKQKK